jgi:hypothetical protein
MRGKQKARDVFERFDFPEAAHSDLMPRSVMRPRAMPSLMLNVSGIIRIDMLSKRSTNKSEKTIGNARLKWIQNH